MAPSGTRRPSDSTATASVTRLNSGCLRRSAIGFDSLPEQLSKLSWACLRYLEPRSGDRNQLSRPGRNGGGSGVPRHSTPAPAGPKLTRVIVHAHTPHKIDRIRYFERRWGGKILE